MVAIAQPAPIGAASIIVVTPGNSLIDQPPIPRASLHRTKQSATSYEEKYARITRLLKQDRALITKIKKSAAAFQIDPIHIVGAIVGEHTFNVDVYDQLQTYYVKALTYFSRDIEFAYHGEGVLTFVTRPQFALCANLTENYLLWSCREDVWDREFRGKTVDGIPYPDRRFSTVFFQPFFAGQTFGLGQVNPLTALMVSDHVHKVTGLPLLHASDGKAVYKTVMDPDLSLPYIAAIIKDAILFYRDISGFDISHNVGLTATLYNTGGALKRAQILAEENRRRQTRGEPLKKPEVNYYGWFVNTKIEELRQLIK